MPDDRSDLARVVDDVSRGLDSIVAHPRSGPVIREVGTVLSVGEGIARVSGLPGARPQEMLRFADGSNGLAMNLDAREIGVVLLDEAADLDAGDEVRRTGRRLDVPVGVELLGRIVDPLGRPLDEKGPVDARTRLPVDRPAPPIMHRQAVDTPLHTGIKIIDTLIPVGRGQRELILGDRQTGKTTLALDAILSQTTDDVLSVYCAIGIQNASVGAVIDDLARHGAMDRCCVVAAPADAASGLQYVAPYAATSIAEYFMAHGRDVLVVYDELTWHARAYRQMSLLLRRPPGREAFPADIFHIHARLLERSTRLKPEFGGGSLTALPIIETEAQNLSAYIPTNLISITDGQIYLSSSLVQQGVMPAVDADRSVSRVGGKAQAATYRSLSGRLRLSYAQFRELEAFARFSSRLDDETRQTVEHGKRVRKVFEQAPHDPIPTAEQVAVLIALTEGVLDSVPVARIPAVEDEIRRAVREDLHLVRRSLEQGRLLDDDDRRDLLEKAKSIVDSSGGPA